MIKNLVCHRCIVINGYYSTNLDTALQMRSNITSNANKQMAAMIPPLSSTCGSEHATKKNSIRPNSGIKKYSEILNPSLSPIEFTQIISRELIKITTLERRAFNHSYWEDNIHTDRLMTISIIPIIGANDFIT